MLLTIDNVDYNGYYAYVDCRGREKPPGMGAEQMFDEMFKVIKVAPGGWSWEVGVTGKRLDCVEYCAEMGWQYRDGRGRWYQMDFVPVGQEVYMGKYIKREAA